MNINQVFEAFDTLRVLVIGDVMLDSYVWGKVERISPEAPVPVVNVQTREYRLGGAGNVLLNVQSLGAEAIICSVIGTDSSGDLLENSLKDKGLNCEGLIRSESRITTIKERIIAGSQQVVRIDTETDKPVSKSETEQLIAKAKELIPSCNVIIFEDYDKGVLTPESIFEITAFANEHNVPTVVDPKKRNFLAYNNTTLFKPNLKELREGLKIEFNVDNPDELRGAVQHLKEALNVKGALITLSERGVIIDFQDEVHKLPAHIRQIADVSGAGDTVISIAACCVALGLPPKTIAAVSNLGGGLVCELVGVVPIDKELLKTEALNLVISPAY
ncbi:bifunctional heptose 7-phosphate kinase/heptose 1-phosphate adenyltransferase [Dyadobacter fanqingshengii]|uniref:PfkB family carbohydrate kinase n=1 Tax=Dyadobacter fanqingshengii TaxID=2906443 RepID=A0A9X1T825_9BACT|nr:bifunctional ADP-heptose synthase [Dyadobacter fanqingshengii]MCF0038479.1 PfkB family carbohydrate kinase [Dyadobacter fanqingshengii]USJ34686.1 bifunctional ADP-heptose synthase [Dyadobacter fanqingshengii]